MLPFITLLCEFLGLFIDLYVAFWQVRWMCETVKSRVVT